MEELASDDPVGFEFAQLLGQHFFAGGRDKFSQLPKPEHAILREIVEKQRFIFPTDDSKSYLHRA